MTLWAACIGGFLFQFDLTALAAARPEIGADLGVISEASAWLIDIYSLGLVLALPASGTLADRFGRRRMFTTGTVLFAASSALCALAPSFGTLLLLRALQGIAGAFLTSAQMALLAHAYVGSSRARAFGISGTVIGASMVAGPPFGALIASTLGWRWIFWINLPLCAAILALVARGVAESSDPDAAGRKIDWRGCLLLALAAGGFAVVLLDAEILGGWWSAGVAVVTGLALLCAVGFVIVERSHNYPAIDLMLFRSRPFAAICVTAAASAAGYWSLLVHVPRLARGPMGLDPAGAGLLLTAMTVPMLVLPRFGARLVSRLPAQLFFPLGLVIVGVADFGLSLAVWTDGGNTLIVVALMASGIGCALINSQITAAAISAVPAGRAAMASAICVTMRQIGFSLGVALLACLRQIDDSHGFSLAFGGAGFVAMAAAAIGSRLFCTATKT